MKFALDISCETAYTDGERIAFHPDFIDQLSDKELEFVLMHEVLHAALGHPFRKQSDYDLECYDKACDIVVNSNILYSFNMDIKSITLKNFGVAMNQTPSGRHGYKLTVEEVYANFIKGTQYDAEGKTLLNRTLPDVKTLYHRMNYQMQYPITVSREQLSKAFVSLEALEKFITNLINTLYNSAELDEFANMKQLIASALTKNAIKKITVSDPLTSEANGKKFIKEVKTVSGLMQFPSTAFNSYTAVQSTDTTPITTFSRKNEQILILDTATDISLNVDVLASIFNMSVAEFNETRKIVIDTFPDATTRAILVDEAFFQIYDDLFTVTHFNNGQGLYDNYYLNVWMTYAYSVLVNAVAFTTATT
jgi:hypothetical protein